MRAPIDGTQRKVRIEAFSSSATALSEGSARGTFSTAGTGDYTITFSEPFARAPVAVANALHATLSLKCVLHTVSTTIVRLIVRNDSGTATAPTAFHVQVFGSDSNDGQLA
jgi:hypothetical protein